MTATDRDWTQLCDEHGRVVREYGRVQQRASDVMDEQARRLRTLEAQVMQLRAAVIIRETALAWVREELEAVKTAVPGLPKRLALAQQVRVLEARIHALMRAETTQLADNVRSRTESTIEAGARFAAPAHRGKVVLWVSQDQLRAGMTEPSIAQTGVSMVRADGADAATLDAGLADADLVICQAGCVSHGDWWRVQDYCTRTGKQCVLVEHPDALERVMASRAQALTDTGG